MGREGEGGKHVSVSEKEKAAKKTYMKQKQNK